MIYAIKINKWLNNNIRQYVYSKKLVKCKLIFKRLLVMWPTREEGLDARLHCYGTLSAWGSGQN